MTLLEICLAAYSILVTLVAVSAIKETGLLHERLCKLEGDE